jgi:hypothetical protein
VVDPSLEVVLSPVGKFKSKLIAVTSKYLLEQEHPPLKKLSRVEPLAQSVAAARQLIAVRVAKALDIL